MHIHHTTAQQTHPPARAHEWTRRRDLTMVGRGTQRMARGKQLHTHTHTPCSGPLHARTHTRGERVSEKNTGLRIEPCGTPGPLGTAAAFNLFVSWMGDWFDSDNEANYVKSSVCSQNGCSECDCLCVCVCV